MSGRRAKQLRRENPVVKTADPRMVFPLGGNRVRSRQKTKNRLYTKKGFAFGNKIGGGLLAIAQHFYDKENPHVKRTQV